MAPKQQYALVPIDELVDGDNVRSSLGDLEHLTESIREHGILEPVVACPSIDKQHVEILMGHRRVAAARSAGVTEIPCLLRAQRPDDRERVLMQLAENLARAEMSPIDEALSYKELIRLGYSRRAIAHAVGKHEVDIGKRLRLLELPQTARLAVDVGWIAPSVALEIPTWLCQDKAAMKRLGKIVQLGADELRRWIREESRPAAGQSRTGGGAVVTRVINVHLDAYEAATAAATRSGSSVKDWASEVLLAAAEPQA